MYRDPPIDDASLTTSVQARRPNRRAFSYFHCRTESPPRLARSRNQAGESRSGRCRECEPGEPGCLAECEAGHIRSPGSALSMLPFEALFGSRTGQWARVGWFTGGSGSSSRGDFSRDFW